jgi:5-methylcytosine-specific restriction endonuclease McrA
MAEADSIRREKARIRAAEWYAKNKARASAAARLYREKNDEAIKRQKREAYLRDREKPEYKAKLAAITAARKDQKREYDKAYRVRRGDSLVQINAAWKAKNPERRKAISQNYKHRRRAHEEGGISSADLHAWKKAAKKVCYWCGKKCARNFTVDHYEPLARGGKHEASNLVIACRPCNIKKNAKDPEQFRAETWHGTLFSSLINP